MEFYFFIGGDMLPVQVSKGRDDSHDNKDQPRRAKGLKEQLSIEGHELERTKTEAGLRVPGPAIKQSQVGKKGRVPSS